MRNRPMFSINQNASKSCLAQKVQRFLKINASFQMFFESQIEKCCTGASMTAKSFTSRSATRKLDVFANLVAVRFVTPNEAASDSFRRNA